MTNKDTRMRVRKGGGLNVHRRGSAGGNRSKQRRRREGSQPSRPRFWFPTLCRRSITDPRSFAMEKRGREIDLYAQHDHVTSHGGDRAQLTEAGAGGNDNSEAGSHGRQNGHGARLVGLGLKVKSKP